MSGTNQLLISANNRNGVSDGYIALVGGGRWDSASSTTNQQIKLQIGATFSEMSALFTGGISNGTLTFRVNGSSGNQTCTGQSTYVTDSTHTDAAVATNLVDYAFTTGFATVTIVTCQMNTATPYALQGSGPGVDLADLGFTTTAAYTSAMGGGGANAKIAPALTCQQAIESIGTLSQFAINISTATSGTGTVNINKNGSTANSSVTAGSGVTGLVLDSTHTDSCSAGDTLCVAVVSTNASGSIHTWTFSYSGVTSGMDATSSLTGTIGAGSSPTYYPFGGTLTNSVTQANSQAYSAFALTASKLRVTWSSATTSATMVFQNGGVTGNETVSWSGSAGVVVDSTHTDSVSSTNLVGGSITSGTSVQISSVGFAPDDGSADDVTGAGAIGVAIAVAGAGTALIPAAGSVGVAIGVSGVGLGLKGSTGAIDVDIAVSGAATGLVKSAGSIDADIGIVAPPKYTFPAIGSVNVNIGVAGAGMDVAINPGGGDVPLDATDWKRKYARWKELEEEAIAAEMQRRQKIRSGVVDAYERSVEGKTDPEPPEPPKPLPPLPKSYSRNELGQLIHHLSIRKHPATNDAENDDEEVILFL